ncbi:hypothetical protein ACOI1H_03915 [Loktanella sp. DJP18]|uniref:hypothetical protein n=1 Tax=Loktanella sp. DJP18 TaxID=3409788 RepID=UPI003BB6D42B
MNWFDPMSELGALLTGLAAMLLASCSIFKNSAGPKAALYRRQSTVTDNGFNSDLAFVTVLEVRI